MKRVEAWLLGVGWLGVLIFPLAGIGAGFYIILARASGSDGMKTSKYDTWSRKQAIPMIVGAILVLVYIAWRARK